MEVDVAVRSTRPVNPLMLVAVTFDEPDAASRIPRLLGVALIANVGVTSVLKNAVCANSATGDGVPLAIVRHVSVPVTLDPLHPVWKPITRLPGEITL